MREDRLAHRLTNDEERMSLLTLAAGAGKLKPELDAWDALRAALPVGTISGAPKVRAMQIIDELEVNRRGPYGGGYGYVSFSGAMDMALALRTMVVKADATEALYDAAGRRDWDVHLQARPVRLSLSRCFRTIL